MLSGSDVTPPVWRSTKDGTENSGSGLGDGLAAGVLVLGSVRFTSANTTATSPNAAATANAPILLFLDDRRCRFSCSRHESTSGSPICLVVISNTSLRSGIRASLSEYGTALRRERADGRRTDAHDPCGLLGAVAVHVEQDEGGALTAREAEQQLSDVLPQVHLVKRVCRRGDRHQPPRGPERGARPPPGPVERHAEQ